MDAPVLETNITDAPHTPAKLPKVLSCPPAPIKRGKARSSGASVKLIF